MQKKPNKTRNPKKLDAHIKDREQTETNLWWAFIYVVHFVYLSLRYTIYEKTRHIFRNEQVLAKRYESFYLHKVGGHEIVRH